MRMGLWVLVLVENCVSSGDYSFHQDIMELQEVKSKAEFDKILADYSR